MMGHYTDYLKTVREPPRAARFQVSTSHSMSTTHIKPPLDNPEDMFDSMSSHAGGRSHRRDSEPVDFFRRALGNLLNGFCFLAHRFKWIR